MSLIGKTVEDQIWNFFMPKVGNAYGVCALMGNWQDESGFKPTNMQNSYEKKLGHTDESYTKAVDDGSYGNFVHDSVGYGLVQWTYWSRKQGLLTLAKKMGRSIGDTEVQLEFAWQELNTGYRGVLAAMKSAKSVKEASDIILTQYEKPQDQSEENKIQRAGYGEAFYKKYVGTHGNTVSASKPTTPSPSAELEAAQKHPNTVPEGGAPIRHVVKKGDTLYSLAKKYGTTVDKIVADNIRRYPKMTARHIVVGWELTILAKNGIHP